MTIAEIPALIGPEPAEAGTRPLRILHVINMGTTCGGAERLVADLVVAQRATGHRPRVLASDRPGSGRSYADATWHQPAAGPLWRRLHGLVRNPAARDALAGEIAAWPPDVVHLHTIGMIAPDTLSLLRDVPTVLTLHGPEPFLRTTERWCLPLDHFRSDDPATLNWRGRLVTAMYRTAVGPLWRRRLQVVDLFIAPSRYIGELMAEDFQPAVVVPNGVATGTPPPTAGASTTGPGMIFVGRFEHFKGPQVLIEAVPAVLAAHPKARFTLCGDGPLTERLRAQIDQLGVGHAVELTGWLDAAEVRRRVAGADIAVIPSMWPEAFGLSCLEAFALGTPVVASAIGALPEIVEDETTGLLVAPDDPGGLAAAVNRLIDEPQTRKRLAAAAQQRSGAYSISDHAEGTRRAYLATVGDPAEQAARPRGRTTVAARLRAAKADSMLRNAVLLLLSTVVLAGGGFLFWQLTARMFSAAEIGQASALISMSTLLANLALLGMNNSLIRYLRAWPDPARTVSSGVAVVAGAALLAGLGFAAGSPFFAPNLADVLAGPRAAAFGLLTVAAAVGMLYDNVFIADRRSGHVLVRNTLAVLLRLALPLALAGLGGFGVFTAYWAAFAVALVPYLLVLRRRYRLRAAVSLQRLRAMWSYSIGTHVATVILMLPTLLMPTVVAERAGLADAGYYYVASLVAGVLLFVPQAASRGLFAEAVARDGAPAGQLRRAVRLTAIGQVPLLLVIIGLGRPLLGLFGAEYQHAYPALVLLAITNALASVGYLGSTLLLVSHRLRLLVVLSAVSYAVSVIGGFLLAPHGLVFVAAALLAGEIILASGYVRVIGKAMR